MLKKTTDSDFSSTTCDYRQELFAERLPFNATKLNLPQKMLFVYQLPAFDALRKNTGRFFPILFMLPQIIYYSIQYFCFFLFGAFTFSRNPITVDWIHIWIGFSFICCLPNFPCLWIINFPCLWIINLTKEK